MPALLTIVDLNVPLLRRRQAIDAPWVRIQNLVKHHAQIALLEWPVLPPPRVQLSSASQDTIRWGLSRPAPYALLALSVPPRPRLLLPALLDTSVLKDKRPASHVLLDSSAIIQPLRLSYVQEAFIQLLWPLLALLARQVTFVRLDRLRPVMLSIFVRQVAIAMAKLSRRAPLEHITRLKEGLLRHPAPRAHQVMTVLSEQ